MIAHNIGLESNKINENQEKAHLLLFRVVVHISVTVFARFPGAILLKDYNISTKHKCVKKQLK